MSEERKLLNYCELSEEWQAEARSNNEEDYEEVTYIEPLPEQTPEKHSLLDLNECMRCNDPEYDGIIGVSNCCSIGVKLIGDEAVILTYLS